MSFRLTLGIYLALICGVSLAIFHLYSTIYPQGISNHENCELIWDAFTPSSPLSNSERIRILWQCGEHNPQLSKTFALYCLVWVAMKSFAIPGSMLLCVALGGFMEDQLVWAQVIASLCETLGGCLCFGLSKIVGRPLLTRLFPNLLQRFQLEMDKRRANMMYFSMFVRISPLVPNWFVNCAAPVVGIRFFPEFFVALLLGTQIGVFLSLRTGTLLFLLLKSLGGDGEDGQGDALLQTQALQNFGIMMAAQFVALVPVYLTREAEKKKDT